MQIINNTDLIVPEMEIVKSKSKPFIEANTKEVTYNHLKNDCVIPVFSKDNEMTISHKEFLDATLKSVEYSFGGEQILNPEIRTSHIVKGRVPSAIGKSVKELLPADKTIYYERMMFSIEIPSITSNINGNLLNLTIGGVRAYNQENLYSKKTMERFKLFIGFKNMVCCNMCVSSDGSVADIRVSSFDGLSEKITQLIDDFNLNSFKNSLNKFPQYELSEWQFAQLVGRLRLYQYLPKEEKSKLPEILLNDGQIANVAKQYYENADFKRNSNGKLNLWNFYNLLTGANKSSYIDTFVDRGVNAFDITQMVANSLEGNKVSWYLN